jgi:hypothetical protein
MMYCLNLWKILRDINKWKVKLKYFYTNIYKENIENIKLKDITVNKLNVEECLRMIFIKC